MTAKHFINLTDGIEWLDRMLPIDGFVRIQSTACEQKRWWQIIADLDYTFLLACAHGPVRVLDASSKKTFSRALYQGVPWVEYCLNNRWLRKDGPVFVRGMNVEKYFRPCYHAGVTATENQAAVRKLDYVKKFLAVDSVQILAGCVRTARDGKYDSFAADLARFFGRTAVLPSPHAAEAVPE